MSAGGEPRLTAVARRARGRPGRARGRDDARRPALGGRGPRAGARGCAGRGRHAVTTPGPDALGQIAVQRSRCVAWTKRHRVYRLPVIRGVVALSESLGIGLRALSISANAQLPEEEQEISGGAWVGHVVIVGRVRDRPVLRRAGRADQPDQGPARLLGAVLARRGRAADGDLPRLSGAALADARPAPGVRVPRRRAQGDLVLRGRATSSPRSGRSSTRGCIRGAARASCWS